MFVQQLLQQQAHQRQHHCPLTRRTQSRREQSISSSNGGGGGGGGGGVGARADAVVALATLDGGERNTAQKPGRRRGRQQRARRGYRSPKRTMCRAVSSLILDHPMHTKAVVAPTLAPTALMTVQITAGSG